MMTALAFLFFPAACCVFIAMALIFADGNPWGRREIPMLEQLAAMEASEPEHTAEWTEYQAELDSAIAIPAVRR